MSVVAAKNIASKKIQKLSDYHKSGLLLGFSKS